MLALLFQEDWEAAGHAGGWVEWLGRVAPWALVALVCVVLVRALVRRGRYRALTVLGEAEQERVRAEIAAAESRTLGEIVPVVLERSDRYPGAEWCAAMALLLLGTALLAVDLPWERPVWVMLVQVGLAFVGFALARALPDFERLFIGTQHAGEMVDEQAFQEFYRHGLHKTAQGTGVLIFVSLLEHRVVVLGDEGIAQKVRPELWLEVDQAVLSGIRKGSLADGLVDGIRRCGEVLAEHFPARAENRDEVRNRLIVRKT